MKTEKIKDNLTKIFFILFSVVFGGLTLSTIFFNEPLECNPLFAGALTLVFFGIIYLIIKFGDKEETFFVKHKFKILALFVVCMTALQVPIGYFMSVNPIGDVGAVFDGAINYVTTGSIGDYDEYFYIFPNNLAGLYIFEMLFSFFSLFKIDNFFAISIIFNSVLVNASVIFVFLTAEKLFSTKKALLVLKIFALCFPLYFYIPVFYTDIISMFFVSVGFYLFVLSQKSEKQSCKNLFLISSGLVFALGSLVKMTVVILLVGAIIEVILRNNFKKVVVPILAIAVIFATTFQAFNIYTYNCVLDKDIAYEENIPYSHWLMMGLKDDGRYNDDDLQMTKSIKGHEARVEFNVQEIKNRLSEFGPIGYAKLIVKKGICSFGSGTYGVELMINHRIRTPNFLHEFVLIDGKYYNIFVAVTQAVHWGIFILVLWGAIKFIKKKPNEGMICAFSSIFGLYLFLMIWESNPRYILNFLPILIICAISSLDKNDKRSN